MSVGGSSRWRRIALSGNAYYQVQEKPDLSPPVVPVGDEGRLDPHLGTLKCPPMTSLFERKNHHYYY